MYARDDPIMDAEVDPKAFFAQALEGVLEQLYGAAIRMAKNPADAEDMVAEAVAKALQHLDDLKDRRCFRSWIFRILTNCFISDCRKRKAEREVPLPTENDAEGDFWLFDKLHQPFLLWFSNPELEFLNQVLRDDISAAIDALPENYRIVVILAELEGFRYAQIADILEIPIGTVRSRLARGRSLLQKALWEHAQHAGLVGGRAHANSDETCHD